MTLDKKNKLLRNKELALKLSMADSEKKVVTILKSHGYWEDLSCWKFYGNNENNYSLIVGSSGLTDESIDNLKKLSKNKLVIVIPNFSIGASYQKLISILIAEEFSNKNIVEKHHSNKKDKPSGTSIDIAKSINTEKNKITDSDTENNFNIINNLKIESIRSDEYLAEQIVNMSNEHEIFNTEHIVKDRKAYLSGINLVLDNLEKLDGYYFGLESIIKDRFKI